MTSGPCNPTWRYSLGLIAVLVGLAAIDTAARVPTWIGARPWSSWAAPVTVAPVAPARGGQQGGGNNPGATLEQCRNGQATNPNNCLELGGGTGWVPGNAGAQNSHYVEGYSIPYRAELINLPVGQEVTLELGYDIKHSGRHAVDFLTHYQRLELHTGFGHTAELVVPTSGIDFNPSVPGAQPPPAAPTTAVIPMPVESLVTPGFPVGTPVNQPQTRFLELPEAERVMTMWGGDLSSVEYVSEGDLTVQQSETVVRVTFTPTNPVAVLAWGGHIGRCVDWGQSADGECLSATGIQGSPYHMRLKTWSLGNLGNEDRSLSTDGVFFTGTITIVKELTAGSADGTFDFTRSFNGIAGNFQLNTAAGTSQVTFTDVLANRVNTVTESGPSASYNFVSLTCTDPDGGTTTNGQTATIDLDPNEHITCTYTNSENEEATKAKILVDKVTVPAVAPDSFDFTLTGTAGFALTDASPAFDSGFIEPGQYSLAELPETGWTLTNVQCTVTRTNGSGPTSSVFTTSTTGPTAITLGAGDTVSCTYTNTRDTGTLHIAKTLLNPDGASVPASFTVNYTCGALTGQVSVAPGSPAASVPNIPTGTTCTVAEVAPTPIIGYTWGPISYAPESVTISNTTDLFEISVGNVITRDKGYLKLTKLFDAGTSGFAGTFGVVYNCGAGDVSVSLAAGASQTFGPFNAGTSCTVSEPTLPAAPTGWSFGTPVVSGSPAIIVTGNEASAVAVTVTNSITRDKGYLKLTKLFDPGTSGFTGAFDVVYNCGTGPMTVQLIAGASTTLGPFDTGTSCAVTEPVLPIAPTGWTFGAPVVTGSPAIIVKGEAPAAVTVTVANSIARDKGNLKLAKVLTGGPAGYTGPFTLAYTCTDGTEGTAPVFAGEFATIPNIPTGTSCTVSEPTLPTTPAGYSFGTPSFSPTATVTIDTNGQTVTVTTNNSLIRDQGYLKLTKTFDPGTSGFAGTFAVVYNCGAGDVAVPLAAGASQTVGPFDAGTSCTVSEPTLPTAPTGWSFGAPVVTGSPATIVKGDVAAAVSVSVANSISRDTGSLKVIKGVVGAPTGFTGSFSVDVNCGAGGVFADHVIAYPTPGELLINGIPTGFVCAVTEDTPTGAPAGYSWAVPVVSGTVPIVKNTVSTITVTNTVTGRAKVVKTFQGAAITGAETFLFELRTGASAAAVGTVVESLTANATNGGTLAFTTALTPASSYQVCEQVMPGWNSTLYGLPGAFVPGSDLPDPDNSYVCVSFQAQAGVTTEFTIDNTPPPGGRAHTIGFWRNWASCRVSGGNQDPVLDRTLAAAALPSGAALPGIVVSATSGTFPSFGPTLWLAVYGNPATPDTAPDCQTAVRILSKRNATTGLVSAGDPAFALAAQLLAAELNYVAGAAQYPAVTAAINEAVLLLGQYRFDGTTHQTIPRPQQNRMRQLAELLDLYNNNALP